MGRGDGGGRLGKPGRGGGGGQRQGVQGSEKDKQFTGPTPEARVRSQYVESRCLARIPTKGALTYPTMTALATLSLELITPGAGGKTYKGKLGLTSPAVTRGKALGKRSGEKRWENGLGANEVGMGWTS